MDATLNNAISEDLIQRFDDAGPSYSSYPTSDRFVDAFTEAEYMQTLSFYHSTNARASKPLSLYIHIPFCESLCYFCTCNKYITKQHEHASTYLRYLRREVELHTDILGTGKMVSQLQIGGGTPTFLTDDELRELTSMLRRNFTLATVGECSIEADPRTVDVKRLDTLAELGFNHLSFGVQDFDPAVQKAIHRVQPVEQVFTLVEAARARNFNSINVDLIYGLPRQSPESFDRTLVQINELRPSRISLYAYVHLPDKFKSQRRIASVELPSASAKVAMLSHSFAAFTEAGYIHIGMDQFALPTDALAIAKRQGRLHRNFHGYTTQPNCDSIGLGVSSIGRIDATYSQNAMTLEAYYDQLDQARFPVSRGLALSRDDLIRRSVIMALLCQGYLSFESIETSFLINFKTYFATEIEALHKLEVEGLIKLNHVSIEVTSSGMVFVRVVAMVFDRYLQTDRNRAKYSKIL